MVKVWCQPHILLGRYDSSNITQKCPAKWLSQSLMHLSTLIMYHIIMIAPVLNSKFMLVHCKKRGGNFPPHWWKNHTLYHFHHGGFACVWVLHQFECVVTTSTWWSALITTILSRHVISMWLQFKSGAKQLRFFRVSFCLKAVKRKVLGQAMGCKSDKWSF